MGGDRVSCGGGSFGVGCSCMVDDREQFDDKLHSGDSRSVGEDRVAVGCGAKTSSVCEGHRDVSGDCRLSLLGKFDTSGVRDDDGVSPVSSEELLLLDDELLPVSTDCALIGGWGKAVGINCGEFATCGIRESITTCGDMVGASGAGDTDFFSGALWGILTTTGV